MEWFKEFIEETRVLWHEKKEELTEESDESIFEIVEEIEELSNKEFGTDAENIIGYLLGQYQYLVDYPKNSETPADVWGIKDYDDFIHVALIQVKSTRDENANAEPLNDDSILELRKLTKFVLERLKKSPLVPKKYRNGSKFVSNGYSGIRILSNKVELIESKSYTFWIPREYKAHIAQVKKLMNIIHRLIK